MIPISKEDLEKHINLLPIEIKKAFLTYNKLKFKEAQLTDTELSELASVEKILKIEDRWYSIERGEKYRIFKKVWIVEHLKIRCKRNFYKLDGVSKSFLNIIDGNEELWEIDFNYTKLPKDDVIKSKKEIVKGKLGCDARNKLAHT